MEVNSIKQMPTWQYSFLKKNSEFNILVLYKMKGKCSRNQMKYIISIKCICGWSPQCQITGPAATQLKSSVKIVVRHQVAR